MRIYKIFQIKDIDTCSYAFSRNVPKNFSLEDYEVVYTGYFKEDSRLLMNTLAACEELFYIFNNCKPEDFTGHSLSVSDVVQIDEHFWYCTWSGWEKVK